MKQAWVGSEYSVVSSINVLLKCDFCCYSLLNLFFVVCQSHSQWLSERQITLAFTQQSSPKQMATKPPLGCSRKDNVCADTGHTKSKQPKVSAWLHSS